MRHQGSVLRPASSAAPSSITAISVLSCSRAVRQKLRSFDRAMGVLHRFARQRQWCTSRRPPHSIFSRLAGEGRISRSCPGTSLQRCSHRSATGHGLRAGFRPACWRLVWGFCCQVGEIDGVLIYWKPRRFVSVRRPSLIDRHESGSDGLRADGREPERSEGNLPSG